MHIPKYHPPIRPHTTSTHPPIHPTDTPVAPVVVLTEGSAGVSWRWPPWRQTLAAQHWLMCGGWGTGLFERGWLVLGWLVLGWLVGLVGWLKKSEVRLGVDGSSSLEDNMFWQGSAGKPVVTTSLLHDPQPTCLLLHFPASALLVLPSPCPQPQPPTHLQSSLGVWASMKQRQSTFSLAVRRAAPSSASVFTTAVQSLPWPLWSAFTNPT